MVVCRGVWAVVRWLSVGLICERYEFCESA